MKAVLRGKLIYSTMYVHKNIWEMLPTNLMMHREAFENQEPSAPQTSKQERSKSGLREAMAHHDEG